MAIEDQSREDRTAHHPVWQQVDEVTGKPKAA